MKAAKVTPQFVEIVINLHVIFYDFEKVAFWLNTKNLNFGGIAPIDLIERGRGHKVLEFTENACQDLYNGRKLKDL